MAESEIQCERRGAAGFIRLERPRALNALTPGMVAGMAQALDIFEHDPVIERVVVTGEGGKAFCAGGDIRLMHDLGRAGRHDEQLAFWHDEYRLNARIARYPKPYVALIDGIVMGGGVGVSLHGSHRVASETFLFAMPEVGIGFFPDVGACHVLSRLPQEAGTFLALTGGRIAAGDALALGLASHFVPREQFPTLGVALEGRGDTDMIIAAHAAPRPAAAQTSQFTALAHLFSATSLTQIVANLASDSSELASATLATLRRVSPTSLAIALRQVREAAHLSLEDCLRMDFRVVSRICRGLDFYEGVRAVIVDKDQAPRWTPSRIEDLKSDVTESYFASLGAGELTFAQGVTA